MPFIIAGARAMSSSIDALAGFISRVSAISHSSIFLRKKKYDDDGGYWRFLVQQKKGRDGLLGGV